MKKSALFLDRDGVINIDNGYVHRSEDFHFIDGIFDLVSAANQAGYLVVVVTNQAGIGRGYYSEAQFHDLTLWMKDTFADHGGKIDAVYFCPYHPEHGIGVYRRESDFRKPAIGMFLQAETDFGINFERSVLIGDKQSDIFAGRLAGVGTLLYLNSDHAECDSIPIRKLSEAVTYLCRPT